VTGIVVLACGGRDYRDRARVFQVLDDLHGLLTIDLLRHGAAPGADTLADEWAEARGVPRDPHPANWLHHGRSAGPRRNSAMARLQADACVAFPGGNGTADMTAKAERAGMSVLRVLDSR
jgi:hypothetical protein